MHVKYQVVVGNIGTVTSTSNGLDANRVFNEYVARSKSGYGRASGESVVLMRGDEILKEHFADEWYE